MSLRCPSCRSPIPQSAARCAICGRSTATATALPPTAALLPPSTPTPLGGAGPARQPGGLRWLLLAGALALALLLVAGFVALALAASAAGLGTVAWPALVGIAGVLAAASLLQVERRRRRLAALLASPTTLPNLSILELVHLFAGQFAAPARGREAFWPPLARTAVCADEAAWRAVAATLLDLAEREIVELDPHAAPAPGGSVQVMSLRLVRPLSDDDAFSTQLLRPLTRRGVGAASTVSDLASQHLLLQRHPARALLSSVREHLSEQGFYRPPGIQPRGAASAFAGLPGAWLSAAVFRPLRADPSRIAQAEPALATLRARLAAWDAHDADQVRILRDEVCAALLRARARARGGGHGGHGHLAPM